MLGAFLDVGYFNADEIEGYASVVFGLSDSDSFAMPLQLEVSDNVD